MKRRAQILANAAPEIRGLLTRAFAVLTLVAFTFQGFVTQTHIHTAPAGVPVAIDQFDGVFQAPSPDKKLPAKNDSQTCPLCQQFASAGQFLTPSAAAIVLPWLAVSVVEVVALTTHLIAPVSHSWRGRAPPHH